MINGEEREMEEVAETLSIIDRIDQGTLSKNSALLLLYVCTEKKKKKKRKIL